MKCTDALLPVRGLLAVAQRAKQPSRAQEDKARAAWTAVPPSCRGGSWWALAASLLRHPGGAQRPLDAGEGRQVASAKDALQAGLKAAPGDAELLAYVAYVSRIAPALSPPLPADACARVREGDPALRDYVCAVQALSGGQATEAARLLAGISARRFPDLAELRAQARKKAGGKAATTPPPQLSCDPFCPAELWR